MSLYQRGPSKPRVRRARYSHHPAAQHWLVPGWWVEVTHVDGFTNRTWWPTHRDAIQYATSSEVK